MGSDSTDTASALSLLTPTESNALWSFLSQADSADVLAPEWGIFANRPELTPRNRDVKEDLARATRSLTQLEDTPGTTTLDSRYPGYSAQAPRGFNQIYKTPNPHPRTTTNVEGENSNSSPFASQSRQSTSLSGPEVRYDAQSAPSSSSLPSSSQSVAIPNTSFAELPANQQSRKRLSQEQPQKTSSNGNKRPRKSSPPFSDPSNIRLSPVASPAVGRRQQRQPQPLIIPPASAELPPQSTLTTSPVSSSAARTSPSEPLRPSHARNNNSNSNSTTATVANSKPPLLSTSQKKANHIQSEQKRRANIRRGYEALCEIVPALREAIRAEEEAERMALAELETTDEMGGGGGTMIEGNPAAAAAVARKKARGKAVAAAFGIEEGEKVDGRAGPRSEAVVLQKSKVFLLAFRHVGQISDIPPPQSFCVIPVLFD